MSQESSQLQVDVMAFWPEIHESSLQEPLEVGSFTGARAPREDEDEDDEDDDEGDEDEVEDEDEECEDKEGEYEDEEDE